MLWLNLLLQTSRGLRWLQREPLKGCDDLQGREVPLQARREKVRHLVAELTGEFGSYMHSLPTNLPMLSEMPRSTSEVAVESVCSLSRCQTPNKTCRTFTLKMPNTVQNKTIQTQDSHFPEQPDVRAQGPIVYATLAGVQPRE